MRVFSSERVSLDSTRCFTTALQGALLLTGTAVAQRSGGSVLPRDRSGCWGWEWRVPSCWGTSGKERRWRPKAKGMGSALEELVGTPVETRVPRLRLKGAPGKQVAG